MHRKPVGYQRSFLEDYAPGVTFYLSESLRAQLHEIGRTPASTNILQAPMPEKSWTGC